MTSGIIPVPRLIIGHRADLTSGSTRFPVQQDLLDSAHSDAGAPLMVDLGGGTGRDLIAFKAKFPSAPGRLILQDREHVISGVDLQDIEKQNHDFFTPQPVKGARIYFTHFIFHNYNDEQSVQILQQVAAAMEKGYSRLILNEWVLPDIGAKPIEALADIQMLFAFGAMERTKSQWQDLLKKAGLKLIKVGLPEKHGEGVVEAEL